MKESGRVTGADLKAPLGFDANGRDSVGSLRWKWRQRKRPSNSARWLWLAMAFLWTSRAIIERNYWEIPFALLLAPVLVLLSMRNVGKRDKHPGMRSIAAFERSQSRKPNH